MKVKSSGIYLITCKPEGRLPLYYVGQSVDLAFRKSEHFSDLKNNKHNNKRMQACWNKFGKSTFSFEVLCECCHEDLDEIEQWFLDEIHGYRRVMNLAKEVNTPNRGRITPPDVRKKISEATKGRVVPPERRKLIAEKLRGRKLTPEQCAKISAKFKGRIFSDEHRKKLGDTRRKPIRGTHVITGEVVIFDGIKSAKAGGFTPSKICLCCQGKQKLHHGYSWEYLTTTS